MRQDTETKERNSAPPTAGASFDESSYPAWVDDRETLACLDLREAAVGSYGNSRQTFLTMTVLGVQPAMDIPSIKQVHSPRLHKVRRTAEKWPSNFRNRNVFSQVGTGLGFDFCGHSAEVTLARRGKAGDSGTGAQPWQGAAISDSPQNCERAKAKEWIPVPLNSRFS